MPSSSSHGSTAVPADPTYGNDEAALRRIEAPPEPAGFAPFWRDRYAEAIAVRTAPELGAARRHEDGRYLMHDITFTSWGGVRLGGWLVRPADGPTERAVVVTHGYGGRSAPDPAWLPERTAAVFPVLRGLGSRSLLPGVPEAAAGHVLHGIESAPTYIHVGCAADIWCAASALLTVVPDPPTTLGYVGGSFGGGIGALALPWDGRFTAAVLYLPSFGHHPLRLELPCVGSGESVRQYAAAHPDVRSVLAYVDAAVAARRLRIPSLLGPALSDPAVPPPGQFALCNAVSAAKEIAVFTAGHTSYPGDDDELTRFQGRARALLSGAEPESGPYRLSSVDDDPELSEDDSGLLG